MKRTTINSHLTVQYILIVLFGMIIIYLDRIGFNKSTNEFLVVIFSIAKLCYYVFTGFKQLVTYSKSDISYYDFLIYLSSYIVVIVFSYTVDYFCLYYIDPSSFSGIDPDLTLAEKSVKLLMLSVLIFTYMGVANVAPESIASEFILMFESIVTFITVIYILSDFINLKESLSRFSDKK